MGYLKIDQAIVVVGGLLLEQAPKALLVSDEQLASYYDPALAEFQAYIKADYDVDFEPPCNFKEQVLDHVRRYLDLRDRRTSICV